MPQTLAPSRAKSALVIALIVLPLVLTAIVKYLPNLTGQTKVSSITILHPRLLAPKEFDYLDEDVVKRLREALADIPGVRLQESPPANMTKVGDDLAKAASSVGADALIVSTLTIDSGIVQLNLQVVEPVSKEILYNTPFQSSIDRYPEMMRAAAAALKRALHGND